MWRKSKIAMEPRAADICCSPGWPLRGLEPHILATASAMKLSVDAGKHHIYLYTYHIDILYIYIYIHIIYIYIYVCKKISDDVYDSKPSEQRCADRLVCHADHADNSVGAALVLWPHKRMERQELLPTVPKEDRAGGLAEAMLLQI